MKALLCVLFMTSAMTAAATCHVTGRVCVEEGGTRVIDGIAITRDCWAWEEEEVCLTNDTGIDGCETLVQDAASSTGNCRRLESSCEESITLADGTALCLKEKERWQCAEQITLPPVNAQWTGKIESMEETVDESACAPYLQDTSCIQLGRQCGEDNGSSCTQAFACGGRLVAGCSALAAHGCREITAPQGSPVGKGQYVCEGGLPDGVLKPGEGEITEEERVPGAAPDLGALSCPGGKPAGECTETARICTDRDPQLREIEGRWYISECWNWAVTYRCRQPGTDSCEQLREHAACRETARSCSRLSADGTCEETISTFECNAAAGDIGASGEIIEDGSRIDGLVHVSTCAPEQENSSCRLIAERCTQEGGTKIVDGIPITKDCWKTEFTYECGEPGGEAITTDNCLPLTTESNCRLLDSVCLGRNEQGSCTYETRTYACGGDKETVQTGQKCDGQLCIAGLCEPAAERPSDSFMEGAALLEIGREAGIYGDLVGDRLFSGTGSGCVTKLAGFSCCRPENAETASAMNNSAFAVSLTLGTQAGMEAIRFAGSPYVYDLLSSTQATEHILQRLYGSAGSGVYEPSLSYYGVTVGWSSAGGISLSFSPMGFFAAVALDMAADYFSCTQDDQLHALRRAQNLCHYVGSFCEKKAGSSCLEKKESWCCFSSRLALAVQTQGRKQLGMGWGTPQAPICRGFTTQEFERLDFSRMDLTPILAETALILGKKTVTDAAAQMRAQKRVETLTQEPEAMYRGIETFTGKCGSGFTKTCPAAYHTKILREEGQ